MLISTLNCEMWPNFSYRGVRSVQLLLLLLLLMVFSSESFGFSPPYAGIAGIGPARKSSQSDKPSFSGEKPGLSETCGHVADNPSLSVRN